MKNIRKKFSYKGVPVNSFGLPIFSSPKSKSKRIKRIYLASFYSLRKKDSPKNLIVMYDIPHEKKKERDWFRRQLKNLDFIMIQKSVWVGPSPLPKEFLDYVKNVGIEKEFKTFKLEKNYKIK